MKNIQREPENAFKIVLEENIKASRERERLKRGAEDSKSNPINTHTQKNRRASPVLRD